jgi:hypothetical protein
MNTTDKPQKHLSHEHKKAKTMKKFLSSSLAAGVLAAAALGLAPIASTAPAGPSTVEATIDELRLQGFDVIVNRIGNGPHDQCTLGAVRPGHEYTRTDSGVPGADDKLLTTLIGKTVYVDIIC